MSFKQEILAALHSGKDHHVLLEIVRRHHAQGQTDKETYELLEQIWRDFGFHEAEDESALRNELEYVMEKVWYFGANVG